MLEIELEIAGIFLVVLVLLAAILYAVVKVKDSIERKRNGRSSSSDTS